MEEEVVDSFVGYVKIPGRVMMLGEHSDWAGGFMRCSNPKIPKGSSIVVPTNEGLMIKFRRLVNHPRCIIHSIDNNQFKRTIDVSLHDTDTLCKLATTSTKDEMSSYFSYACGVVYKITTDFILGDGNTGIEIDNYSTTLPIGKGLSSSAAICVAIATAFSNAFDLKLSTRGIMEIAYVGETLTGSKCGRADQALAFNSPVLLSYDGNLLHVKPITIRPDLKLYFVIVDLCAYKSTVDILNGLQQAYPFAKTKQHENVHRLFGEMNQSIVDRAVEILSGSNSCNAAFELGCLFNEAQENMDRYGTPMCPAQLSAPVLHQVLSHQKLQKYVLGGKGIGAGGDGSVQLICVDEEAQKQVVRIIEEDLHMKALPLILQ